MSERFNPSYGLVVADARLWGPRGPVGLRLALDTGATRSLIRPTSLTLAGYDLSTISTRARISTASATHHAAIISVARITALGCDQRGMAVLAHDMPSGLRLDGLLGLDFLRGRVLSLDFRSGTVDLS